jgi:hypothetical protein
MRAMLSKMGYFEVVTAEDGEQVANPILSHKSIKLEIETSHTRDIRCRARREQLKWYQRLSY